VRENLLKRIVRKTCFPHGAVRTVRFGPLRGMVFRTGPITGMSPWYSGGERGHQEAFENLVGHGDVVIDIGANWGLHTLYLSRLVSAEGRVIAVEPFLPAFAELEWHIRQNCCPNVTTLALAISDREGEALFLPGESAYTGSLAPSSILAAPKQSILVTTQTLDQVVESLGLEKLALIKIDVEGAEARVLGGAEKLVSRFRPHFVIDLHTPEQDVQVASWLTARGYCLERLSGPPISRTDVGWPDLAGVWGSIAAFPR
jgi:FkbM family methyltransferase